MRISRRMLFGKSAGKRKRKRVQKDSCLELRWDRMWNNTLGGPQLKRQHKFHATRKWQLDFAHVPTKTAIEIEGGVWQGGRHTRGVGFIKDCEKYNTATLLGWTVFRIPGPHVCEEWAKAIIQFIKEKHDEANIQGA